MKTLLCFYCFNIFVFALFAENAGDKDPKRIAREKLKKKDVRDYTDADVEELYEQWEEDEEPLEEDELPEWKRPSPKLDLSKLDVNNPENFLKLSKKGKTLMMFATVSGDPEQSETEKISQLWQTGLYNAHIDVQRYIVSPSRVLFVLKDGALAWDVKDYLLQQERCEEVTLEGQDYKGKGSSQKKNSLKREKDIKTDL